MNPETNPELFPKVLDQNTSTFEANGHMYYVERSYTLSIERDKFLERFGVWALLSRQSSAFITELRAVLDTLNESRLADAAIQIQNILRGAAEIEAKESPLYYICTLFINRADEDRRHYSIDFGKQKILDWQAEGFTNDFFLATGLRFLQTTGELWKEHIQNISGLDLPNLSLE